MKIYNSRYNNLRRDTHIDLPDVVNVNKSDPLAIHICELGDTIENISYKYYGTTKLFWVILYCNDIVDPFIELQTGDRIVIPNRLNIPNIIE